MIIHKCGQTIFFAIKVYIEISVFEILRVDFCINPTKCPLDIDFMKRGHHLEFKI